MLVANGFVFVVIGKLEAAEERLGLNIEGIVFLVFDEEDRLI